MSGGWGVWLLAWIKEARAQYPDDLESQALYVRKQAIAKRNEVTGAALTRPSDHLSARDGSK